MPFNIEQARKSGKTDKEIADYLIDQFPKFNAAKARATGKTDTEIAEYLSGFNRIPQIRAPREYVPEWGREHPNLYGALGAGRAAFEQVVKPLISAGGLIGGGTLGIPTGPMGQVAGAGLGYGIAENINNQIENFINKIEYGTNSRQPITSDMKKAMYDVLSGTMMEMGGQSAGKLIVGAADKILAPYSKTMTLENRLYRSMAREKGIQPTPSDITQSKSLGLFESMMEKSITASDYITKFRLREQLKPLTDEAEKLMDMGAPPESINVIGRKIWADITDVLEKQSNLKGDALNEMRATIIGRLGSEMPLETLGLAGKELLKARSIASFEHASRMYQSVGQSLPEGAKYQTPKLSEVAKKILGLKKELPNQDKKMMAMLKWAAREKNVPDDVLAELGTLPENVREAFLLQYGDDFLVKRDWATLQEFGSDLYNLAQKEDAMYGARAWGTKGQSTKEAGVYKQLRKALFEDLENIARTEGGNAWEQFQAANFFYREEFKGVYGQSFIKKLAASNPEKLVDIGFKPNGITEVKMMKKAIGPEGFDALKTGFTRKLLGSDKHDVFDPKFLRNNLIKYGNSVLKEIYGTTELSNLKQIAQQGLDLNKQLPGFQFLKTITKTYPDTIVDAIIGAPESKLQSHTLVKNLSIIKSAVGKDYIKQQLGYRLLDKLFAKEAINGFVKPHTMSRLVDKYGDRVLKILFGPDKVNQIKQLGEIGRRMQTAERLAGNPSGTGQTIMTWGTLGIIFRNPIKGTLLAITPRQMAKIYLSDFGLKYFTEGFKTPVGSKEGIALATKLSSIIGTQANDLNRAELQPIIQPALETMQTPSNNIQQKAIPESQPKISPKQLKTIVKTSAIEAETGKPTTIKQTAKEAIADVENRRTVLNNLMEKVKSRSLSRSMREVKMSDAEKKTLKKDIKDYRDEGYSPQESNEKAIQDWLRDLDEEQSDIMKQIGG